jgi:isopentenyl-diphosphate Delta-isomerase
MANPNNIGQNDQDPNASERKKDHIDLAFKSKVLPSAVDTRFYYEPMISGHPKDNSSLKCMFDGKSLDAPIWVSSMTGGTEKAKIINENLAKACDMQI